MVKLRNIMLLCLFVFLCVVLLSPSLQAAARRGTTPAVPAVENSAPAEPVNQFVLNMSGVYPLSHPIMRNTLLPWADQLLQESNGRLVVRFFEPGMLADSNSLGRATRLGQLDVAISLMSAEADGFRLGLLAAQAPGSMALPELSAAYWRMYTEVPELAAEFEGIKLLAVYATGPDQLCMSRKLPYDVKSLKGLRFLLDNPLSEQVFSSLGAWPSIVPQTDFKMYMEDKVADGMLLSPAGIYRLGIQDAVSGIGMADLSNNVAWLGMHQGSWDMLPKDLQAIIIRHSALTLSQSLGQVVKQSYKDSLAELGRRNIKFHYFSAEEREHFYKSMRIASELGWQELEEKRTVNVKALQGRINKIMTEAKAR